MGGDFDERAAVVVGHHLHSRRQRPVAVDLLDLGLDQRQHVVGVLGSAHHDDGGGDVVLVVAAGDAEARDVADGHVGNVLDSDGDAAGLVQDHVLDVLDVVALGQVVVATVVDQADAADVHRLLADGDLASADVDVGVAERGDHLRDGDVVGLQLAQVGVDVELLGRAAPAVDLDDARHGQQPPRHHPVLDRAQVGQAEVLGAYELVAIDLADQTGLLDLRDLVARQVDVLLQVQRRLRVGREVVDPVLEGDAHERQAVERRRAYRVDARRRVQPDLHRDRVVLLHLLRGLAGRLRGDLQDHRSRIGVGLDVELEEGRDAGRAEDEQTHHNDGAARQTEGDEGLDHGVRSIERGASGRRLPRGSRVMG